MMEQELFDKIVELIESFGFTKTKKVSKNDFVFHGKSGIEISFGIDWGIDILDEENEKEYVYHDFEITDGIVRKTLKNLLK